MRHYKRTRGKTEENYQEKLKLDKHRVFMSAPFVHFTLTLLITQIGDPGVHASCVAHRADGAPRTHEACGFMGLTGLMGLIGAHGGS